MFEFGDYVIYVDESGDHSLTSIDTGYPVFVLAFCIFEKKTYNELLVPKIKKLKFDLFGHDAIVFHEREIRKSQGNFSIFINAKTREYFNEEMNKIMTETPVTIIVSVINKNLLTKKYANPGNPYNLSLGFCIERAAMFLEEKGQAGKLTHIIVEGRGKNEDRDLELSFRQIIGGVRVGGLVYNVRKSIFDIRFTHKQANMAGLQFADMIARPIGRHVMDASQSNRAMDTIKTKFLTDSKGNFSEFGLKVFP